MAGCSGTPLAKKLGIKSLRVSRLLTFVVKRSEVMMRWIWIVSICCFIAIVLGCGGIGYAYEKRLVGNLGLTAVDTRKQMAVVEFNGNSSDVLVRQTVFAVGWDESHIIAKQHPWDDSGEVDKATTHYFIVVVRDRKAHGPFDEPEYRKQRKILGVAKSLDFTLKFDDLE